MTILRFSTRKNREVAQRDSQGILFPTANAQGIDLYRVAVRQHAWFQASVLDTLDAAIGVNPEFGMPYFAKAYLLLYMTEPAFRDQAKETMAELRECIAIDRLSSVEQAHAAAVEHWACGKLNAACTILERLGIEEPREILGLRVGHEMDFFAGATRNLRDRVARQMRAWTPRDPDYGIVLGAYAFGLVENGHFDEAEVFGRRSLECNRNDAWALHAVAHSFEMRGMAGEGIRFMTERIADWSEKNLFAGHNWWHAALFYLDSGDTQCALSIYDKSIYNETAQKIALVMLDAASMLWRMHLDGINLAGRAAALSADWRVNLPAQPYYHFNDMHATMAHVAAQDLAAAREVVSRMDRYLEAGDDGTDCFQSTRLVCRPICKGLVDFGEGRYAECVDQLYGARMRAQALGGSAAQRDVLDRTILTAALRGGLNGFARALASERVTLKELSPWGWRRYADALLAGGASEEEIASAIRSRDSTAERARLQSGQRIHHHQ